MSINSKVAIVTGASKGIGRAIALSLASSGYNILINYFNSENEAKKTKDLVQEKGVDSTLYRADVSNRTQVQNMIKYCIKWGKAIDVLVNNAGILEQKDFYAINDQEWTETLNINLQSAFICTQEASKLMLKNSSIVNISSIGGQIGGPNAPHYSAAKGALLTFTKSTAKLLAPKNIRVNAVAPGFIETEMFTHILSKQNKVKDDIVSSIPIGRIGTPADVGDAVDFLVSSKASYITGQVLNVNGGSLI